MTAPRLFALALLTAGSLAAEEKPVSFREQIAPILLEKCQACHGPRQQKGGYRVDTFAGVTRREADGNTAVVPRKPDESSLYDLLVTDDAHDRMPQKADALPAAHIELIRRWIAEGANADGVDPAAPLIEIAPARQHAAAPEVYPAPIVITALAFAADGSELIASGLRELTVWSMPEGRLVRRIGNVAPRTFALALSPDGALVAAAGGAPGEFGEVRIFEVKSGTLRRSLAPSTDAVLDVKFSPDGALLATAGIDQRVMLFDAATGGRRAVFTGHLDSVTAVAFSPDGRHLVSASADRTARIHEIATGQLVNVYREHEAPIYALAFEPDGKRVVSAGRDKTVHAWSFPELKRRKESIGVKRDVLEVLVAGDRLFIAGADRRVLEFGLGDFGEKRALEPHPEWIHALAMHPETERAAAGCYDGSVLVWDLASGALVKQFVASPLAPTAVSVARD